MNTLKLLRIGTLSLLAAHVAMADPVPEDQPLPVPTYGINLGNTLEPPCGEGCWGPAATQAVIDSIAAQGFNAIRIPCAWDSNADQTTFEIDPTYMARVKQVVDWSLDAGMYVLINCHWDGGWMENNLEAEVNPLIDEKMDAYWTQIATTFADYDNRLLFAGGNEPHIETPDIMETLLAYYQTFVDAVRRVGGNNTNRWLVMPSVSPPSWMDHLPTDPTPNRIMVEYHSYMPSLFTIIHDDPEWGRSIYYWGEAYFNDADPTRNATFYAEDAIDWELQALADQYVDKGIPVLIGEFGAYLTKTLSGTEAEYNRASTLYWNNYLAEGARARGISPFLWTIQSDIFDWSTGAVLDPEMVDMVTGGIAPPPPNGAPFAVTGLTATNTGESQIDLAWNAVDGATSYNLHRGAGSGLPAAAEPFATGVTDTTYTDTGLNDGTTYYYQVVAVNDAGPSGFTTEAHATTPGTKPDPTQFHFEADTQRWKADGGQISNVAISAERSFAGNRSLAVNFDGTSGGTSSISLDRAVVPGGETVTFHVWIPEGSAITSIEAWLQDKKWNASQTTFNNLTADSWNTLEFTVPENAIVPFVNFGLRFTTSGAWTGTCYVDSISWRAHENPFRPVGLATTSGSTKVTLDWDETDLATSYKIQRSTTEATGYETIASADTTTFTDNALDPNTTYYYVVVAVNEFGESVASTIVSAIPSQTIEEWRMENFGTTENTGEAADGADPDGDRATNWQEYISGTDPKDPKSVLVIERLTFDENDIVVRFPTVEGKTYRLEKSYTLLADSWSIVQDNIAGTGNTIEITDSGADSRFYRLAVTP
ncbi:cellulase family glycosylhydrolase [Pelagicoccus sp. SDUM812003]|uniref:cellulase family glycosylhydrolase n=1 Tax=Pelagicoccus sp. SDUM812003 TaxID=3041267 RepID=UPI00280DE86B|nr:cellulase family glycosylhydrolase [Pelagicoccus sp. SDUM812003]MDQ8202169.1 cellulase family glycosylhydrolase [Pelagicoccus sp. SDUM812003]